MTTKDMHNNITISRVLSPGAAVTDNTAQVSQIVDKLGYESVEYAIAIGSLADADATFTVLLEDGDESDLSDNAAIADAFLLGTEAAASFTFAADNGVRRLGSVSKKRYERMTITPAANSGDAYFSVVAILGNPKVAPVANNT